MAGELPPKPVTIEAATFASNKAFPGKDSVVQSEIADPGIVQFADGLNKLIADLAAYRAIDMQSISAHDQQTLALTLFNALLQGISHERSSVDIPVGDREGLGPITVDVDPLNTELTVANNQSGQAGTIRMGRDRKVMMAFFTGLTMAKLARFKDPWITRKEVASFTNFMFTHNQFHYHLLEPLNDIGLIEKNNKYGYRLVCDPKDMIKTLGSNKAHMKIDAKRSDKWGSLRAGTPLFGSHEIPVMKALQQQAQATGEGTDRLSISKLMEETGLSEDSILRLLRELEKKGVIQRSIGKKEYRTTDIRRDPLDQILSITESNIVIRVTENGKPIEKDENFGPTRRLAVAKVKYISEFPELSWGDIAVETDTTEYPREKLLSLINTVLVTDLSYQTIIDDKLKTVYKGLFPRIEQVNKSTVIRILDILGIGHRELERLPVQRQATLAAAIRALEVANKLPENRNLGAEIKSRLATILSGTVYESGDVASIPFAELMEELTSAAEKLPEAPSDKVVYHRAEIIPPAPNKKLLDLMKPHFRKEISSATGQDRIPAWFMQPVEMFNFHRSLSFKAMRIPWDTLTRLGLAQLSGADHHPEILPAGALVTALFMNNSIRNRVGAISRGEEDALKKVARHARVLLENELKRLSDKLGSDNVKTYIKSCISELDRANLE